MFFEKNVSTTEKKEVPYNSFEKNEDEIQIFESLYQEMLNHFEGKNGYSVDKEEAAICLDKILKIDLSKENISQLQKYLDEHPTLITHYYSYKKDYFVQVIHEKQEHKVYQKFFVIYDKKIVQLKIDDESINKSDYNEVNTQSIFQNYHYKFTDLISESYFAPHTLHSPTKENLKYLYPYLQTAMEELALNGNQQAAFLLARYGYYGNSARMLFYANKIAATHPEANLLLALYYSNALPGINVSQEKEQALTCMQKFLVLTEKDLAKRNRLLQQNPKLVDLYVMSLSRAYSNNLKGYLSLEESKREIDTWYCAIDRWYDEDYIQHKKPQEKKVFLPTEFTEVYPKARLFKAYHANKSDWDLHFLLPVSYLQDIRFLLASKEFKIETLNHLYEQIYFSGDLLAIKAADNFFRKKPEKTQLEKRLTTKLTENNFSKIAGLLNEWFYAKYKKFDYEKAAGFSAILSRHLTLVYKYRAQYMDWNANLFIGCCVNVLPETREEYLWNATRQNDARFNDQAYLAKIELALIYISQSKNSSTAGPYMKEVRTLGDTLITTYARESLQNLKEKKESTESTQASIKELEFFANQELLTLLKAWVQARYVDCDIEQENLLSEKIFFLKPPQNFLGVESLEENGYHLLLSLTGVPYTGFQEFEKVTECLKLDANLKFPANIETIRWLFLNSRFELALCSLKDCIEKQKETDFNPSLFRYIRKVLLPEVAKLPNIPTDLSQKINTMISDWTEKQLPIHVKNWYVINYHERTYDYDYSYREELPEYLADNRDCICKLAEHISDPYLLCYAFNLSSDDEKRKSYLTHIGNDLPCFRLELVKSEINAFETTKNYDVFKFTSESFLKNIKSDLAQQQIALSEYTATQKLSEWQELQKKFTKIQKSKPKEPVKAATSDMTVLGDSSNSPMPKLNSNTTQNNYARQPMGNLGFLNYVKRRVRESQYDAFLESNTHLIKLRDATSFNIDNKNQYDVREKVEKIIDSISFLLVKRDPLMQSLYEDLRKQLAKERDADKVSKSEYSHNL